MNVETILETLAADSDVDLEGVTQDAQRAVVAAERAAQASLVHYDDERPAELDDALLARVRANLATDHGRMPVRRIGRTGEVRDLEHPFTLRGRAEANAEAAPAPAPKRARKTTAKKAAKKASGT